MTDNISELLHRIDPARRVIPDARTQADDLTRILRDRRHRFPRRRIAALAVAATIAIAVLGVQPWDRSGSAVAGTPPLLKYTLDDPRPARVQLLELARRVAAQPPDAAPSGPVLRIATKGWYLVSGENTESHLEPQTITRYVLNGKVTTDEDPGAWSDAMFREPLSSDPAVLSRQLQAAHPPRNGPSWVVTAISDLYQQAAPSAEVRAASLTLLARQPEVRAEGSVTDRSDRPGIGFSVTSGDSGLPTRTTLIFDSSTGKLLDVEKTLTESSGAMNLPIPSVIEYQVFTGQDYVAEPPR